MLPFANLTASMGVYVYTNTTFIVENNQIIADCDNLIQCLAPGPTTGRYVDPDIGCISFGTCLLSFTFDKAANNTCFKNVDQDREEDSVFADVTVNFDENVGTLEANYPELLTASNIRANEEPPDMTLKDRMIATAALDTIGGLFGQYLPQGSTGTVTGSTFDFSEEFLIDVALTDNAGNVFMGPANPVDFIDAIQDGSIQNFQGCMALTSASHVNVINEAPSAVQEIVLANKNRANTATKCCSQCRPQ